MTFSLEFNYNGDGFIKLWTTKKKRFGVFQWVSEFWLVLKGSFDNLIRALLFTINGVKEPNTLSTFLQFSLSLTLLNTLYCFVDLCHVQFTKLLKDGWIGDEVY